jgi:outer membrane protein OmpA-like peptidoglycan-associated protein
MIDMTNTCRRLMVPVLLAAVLSGCVTSGEVYSTTDDLLKKLESFREAGTICAPKEFASTEAACYFARTEADFGDTLKAKAHLDAAREWFTRTYALTHTPDNAIREGCEGDDDDDGVLNSKDRCLSEAEDYDGDQDTDGCPEWDKDGDGIPDDKDQCPSDAEDKDGFEDQDGCPDKDNDLDGITDEKDKCPVQPEDFDQFEDEDGCPEADNDKDGIPDAKDKCPNQPEDFDGDQDDDGCPDLYKSIIVKEDKIELKQKIFFAFNKAKILPQSFAMLEEVASALKEHADLKVRIEGHTDSKGSDKYNLKLSDDRAKSVRDFMIKQGIAADRMIAIGYGEAKPIADNETEEGREINRRVEFFIITEK